MADVDFGTDLYWGDDCDATDRLTDGFTLLGQAVYHRLITPPGALIDDSDYGLGIQTLLHQGMTATEVAAFPKRVEQECLKDERIHRATVKLLSTLEADGLHWNITIKAETALGPFTLVLGVAGVTVALLENGNH